MHLRVPFSDVDMHGHVHNGIYFSYVETAINEFLRTSNLSGHFDPRMNDHAYHVKKVEVIYHRPAGLDDILDVATRVARIGISSIVFAATVTRAADSSVVAEAKIVWVCVERGSRQTIPVPQDIRAALTPSAGDDTHPFTAMPADGGQPGTSSHLGPTREMMR